MSTWEPITDDEFLELFKEQYKELNEQERKTFNRYMMDFWKAIIVRSEQYGIEHVYVVAQYKNGVLYFDDVEYGFNISTIDEKGRILIPGGSQATLKEAILNWFPAEE